MIYQIKMPLQLVNLYLLDSFMDLANTSHNYICFGSYDVISISSLSHPPKKRRLLVYHLLRN